MKQKAEVVELITKDKLKLNGLWFGPENPDRVYIFVHGLTDSAFGHHNYLNPLVNFSTATLYFSNRGSNIISSFGKIDLRKKKGYKGVSMGMALENFTNCVHDLQAAVDLAKDRGAKEIYLVGHSTGCQKSIYYLSKGNNQSQIKAVVLLCPVSDYFGMLKLKTKEELKKTERVAREMVNKGIENHLLPEHVWNEPLSAQRFLSLYTLDSDEEIFTYGQASKIPHVLQKVTIPTLTVFAGNDEYADRPAEEIAEWFKKHSRSKNLTIKIIKNSFHSFQGKEKEVTNTIEDWFSHLAGRRL